ncbi:unnamed protein product [Musa hybrid cultivar]
MASQEYLYKMLLRQTYRNLWLTDLMSTIQADFSRACVRWPYLNKEHDIMQYVFFMLSVGHAFPTCSAEGLFTMTCQGNFSGPSVARVIYHAVGNVEKVDAQSSAFARRFSCALVILLPRIASCSKMSSTYRRLNAKLHQLPLKICLYEFNAGIYGLSATSCLGLFHCCNDHRKSGDPKKLPRYYPLCLTLYTGRKTHVLLFSRLLFMLSDIKDLMHLLVISLQSLCTHACRHSIRLRWIRETASLGHHQ